MDAISRFLTDYDERLSEERLAAREDSSCFIGEVRRDGEWIQITGECKSEEEARSAAKKWLAKDKKERKKREEENAVN